MKFITETALRNRYQENRFESFVLHEGEKLTPAARQFLTDKKIKIHSVAPVAEKPEHCTHLRGSVLVAKDHPVIKFRGQLDLLEANFILCIQSALSSGHQGLAADLNVIFLYLQEIMRAEVRDKPLPFIDFHGWSADEVREYSHHPEKHLGAKHTFPDPKHGALYGEIHKLRAMVRQLEITGVEAFRGESGDQRERPDILLAVNRLSSLLYILICQLLGGQYET